MAEKLLRLADGVDGLFIKNDRFNTTSVSCNFYLPLKGDTAASFALLPFMLTTCSKKYPDFSRLNYKLNRMYGAGLEASAEKYGDYQLLRMSVSVINDRYTLDGESLVRQAAELLLGLIFEPSTENGEFSEYDLSREKRKAVEHIKGEYGEKRIYAKNRLIEEMYKGQPYGLPKCGTVEEVEAVTGRKLYEAWETALACGYIRFQVIGSYVPSGLFETISERFSVLSRSDITDISVSTPTAAAEAVNTVTESSSVNQGKLVMGFSTDMHGNDDESLPLMVMSDIFGGGPYSRLFANVREKMSLCYYCSASAVRQKGLLTVESGVEATNAERAQEEIINQLNSVKNGEFSDFEFESSIKSICDSLNSYNDSQAALDTWYVVKAANTNLYSPTDIAEAVRKITRDDVTEAAKGVRLHTVYRLLPKETERQNGEGSL